MIRQFVICLAALLSAGTASAQDSYCEVWVHPTAATLPASLPGIVFDGAGLAGELDDPTVQVSETLPDGATSAVPVTIEVDGSQHLARFDRPLIEGATYDVRVDACESYSAEIGAPRTLTFTATAALPFPTTLGTLAVGPPEAITTPFPTFRGDGSQSATDIVARTLDVTLSDDSAGWRDVLSIVWFDGSQRVPVITLDERARVFHTCKRAFDSITPGHAEGTFTLEGRPVIPGYDGPITPVRGEVSLDCEAVEDGCGAAPGTSLAAVAIAFLAARAGRRRGRA